ncbi:DUF1534 domain-containing protein [Pseudomonas syringae]|nr:DUF1534 domain-containing protein [Pseudomonas syringae]
MGTIVKGLAFLTLQRGNAFRDALRHTRLRSLHHAEFNPRRRTVGRQAQVVALAYIPALRSRLPAATPETRPDVSTPCRGPVALASQMNVRGGGRRNSGFNAKSLYDPRNLTRIATAKADRLFSS